MNKSSYSNKCRLKDAVIETVEKPVLSEDVLNKLLNLQDQTLSESESHNQTNAFLSQSLLSQIWAKPIATLTVIFIAILSTVVLINQYQSSDDIAQQIANEVVNNHLKLKPLDVKTNTIKGIQTYFTQLDFMPIRSSFLSKHFALADRDLLGGRYCSIKGVTAAQLRYTQAPRTDGQSREVSTLYQVTYDETLHGRLPKIETAESPKNLVVKGLRVSLWVERGLLFVLVTHS